MNHFLIRLCLPTFAAGTLYAETIMSEYTSVCQAVDKVDDDDVREMFGWHFANLRQELL